MIITGHEIEKVGGVDVMVMHKVNTVTGEHYAKAWVLAGELEVSYDA